MRRSLGYHIQVLLAMASVLCVGTHSLTARAQSVDSTEASLRVLKRAVTTQRDGGHLQILFALRQLHDPSLRPFFENLLKSKSWQIQVHAALGLAEVSSDNQLDPQLVALLAPEAQDAVIATALDLKLLKTEAIPTLLASDSLQPMARLVLLAEAVAPMEGSKDAENSIMKKLSRNDVAAQLKALQQSDDPHVYGLAACLLAQLGDTQSLADFQSRINIFDATRQNNLRIWMMDAVRRYRLAACLTWIIQQIDQYSSDGDLAYRGVFAALTLDSQMGVPLWTRMLGENPGYSQRVRYCMALLSSDAHVSPETYDRLAAGPDEELLQKMVAIGKAIATDQDETGPLIDLLDLGHALTSDWALQRTAKLSPDNAAKVYEHLLDRLRDVDADAGDAISLAVTASARLADLQPQAALTRLQQAPDDSLLQQALLLGLFESKSSGIGEAAASLKRIGSGRADSLALLLQAKYAQKLPAADVEQLGKIAAGGGRVSEILQAQAAWFYLKHVGKTDQALNTLSQEVVASAP